MPLQRTEGLFSCVDSENAEQRVFIYAFGYSKQNRYTCFYLLSFSIRVTQFVLSLHIFTFAM